MVGQMLFFLLFKRSETETDLCLHFFCLVEEVLSRSTTELADDGNLLEWQDQSLIIFSLMLYMLMTLWSFAELLGRTYLTLCRCYTWPW